MGRERGDVGGNAIVEIVQWRPFILGMHTRPRRIHLVMTLLVLAPAPARTRIIATRSHVRIFSIDRASRQRRDELWGPRRFGKVIHRGSARERFAVAAPGASVLSQIGCLTITAMLIIMAV